MINELSTKLNTEMKLPALRVGEASPAKGTPASPASTTAETKTSAPKTEAKPAAKAEAPVKMDMRSAMLYSKALEAVDAGNKAQATELFRQVVNKFPTFGPAKAQLAKLGG